MKWPQPWKESLNIKQYLGGDPLSDDDPASPETIEGLKSELKKSKQLDVDTLLDDLEGVSTVEDLDAFLENLYDEADAKRVWLGLM